MSGAALEESRVPKNEKNRRRWPGRFRASANRIQHSYSDRHVCRFSIRVSRRTPAMARESRAFDLVHDRLRDSRQIHQASASVPSRAWIRCRRGPMADLPMPVPGMRVAFHSVLNLNRDGRNLVLGDAPLRRNTNVQQFSVSHGKPPHGNLRCGRRTSPGA
jgi:hypothetical protein